MVGVQTHGIRIQDLRRPTDWRYQVPVLLRESTLEFLTYKFSSIWDYNCVSVFIPLAVPPLLSSGVLKGRGSKGQDYSRALGEQ